MGEKVAWLEDIYWTHFKFVHFAQLLPSGYDQHLALPKRFSDNLRGKLPDNVTLKGPGGGVWTIGLTAIDNTLHFTHGWQQFVKDNLLEKNDLLVFKYNGESQFDVLIFDQKNLCEKVASYFVRESGDTKKRNRDIYLEEVNIPSNIGVECASPVKSVHGESKKTCNAAVECTSLVQTKRRGRPKGSNVHAGKVKQTPDAAPVSTGRKRTCKISYTSKRKSVTEDEKMNALERAQAACDEDGFYVVMRPTHVCNRFYVSIPSKWITANYLPPSENLILRVGESEWPARYSYEPSRRSGGLTGGWKHFALDNNLQEFDVCVFKPAGKVNKPLILEVKIFRVDEEFGKVNSGGEKVR